jgi:hypothetical protein
MAAPTHNTTPATPTEIPAIALVPNFRLCCTRVGFPETVGGRAGTCVGAARSAGVFAWVRLILGKPCSTCWPATPLTRWDAHWVVRDSCKILQIVCIKAQKQCALQCSTVCLRLVAGTEGAGDHLENQTNMNHRAHGERMVPHLHLLLSLAFQQAMCSVSSNQ